MDKIDIHDVDFDSLSKIKYQGTQSTIYTDGAICYKIFKNLTNEEIDGLYRKFSEMDGLKIENVILPREFIFDNAKLQGYTMDYFIDSAPLSEKFLVRYVDSKKILDAVMKASKILRTIHQNNITCQDFSFENILINELGNVMYCDLDGCSYKEHISPFISVILKRFFIDFRRENYPISANMDRISMMISFCYLMYAKEIQNLTRRQYHKLSDNINTLENVRQYANVLLDRKNPIGEIPYLDELIDTDDDYVYDREKQLSLVKRLLKKL